MDPSQINPDSSTPEFDLDAAVASIVARHPVVGLAVGIVRNGRVEAIHGHGRADVESGHPIDEDTVFRIASITKTFTAISVMQLVERGMVELDAPANDYLRAFRLIPADSRFRPATVRHLLTHTAGLPEVAHITGLFRPDFGESFPAREPMPTLAAFYDGALHTYAEPGTRFVYNNHGPSALGQLVEDVTGESLAEYFRRHIFDPLGMADSDLLRTDRLEARRATGYEMRSGRFEAVTERDMVTAGAASIFSTPRDMARYLAALLGGGSNQHGTILEPSTLASMFEPHHLPDPRIPGMGLGFFLSDLDGRVVARHQGTHPGFHSEIAVVPAEGIGVMAFTNGAQQADFWLPAAARSLLREAVSVAPTERVDVARRPIHGECGWYRLSARVSDVRLRGMMGAGAEVFVRGGDLMFRFLTPIPALARGFLLHPDDPADPDVFRIDLPGEGMGPIRVVFSRDPSGEVDALHLDVMPLTLVKQSPSTNPRRWGTGVAVSLLAAGAVCFMRARRGT